MAAFGDKIQALMDEVYSEWQKEENKGKGKWDVLGGFSEAHQIAVVFGNFNRQVENGGISQWIYNGYFMDDSEKLTEYLEIGAKSDERCRTILDRLYKLDQYANETDCDRYGYYNDPDGDGENGFIGEMINGDAFDSWYYERCGKDDWWEVVGGIIETMGHGETLVKLDEQVTDAPEPIWTIRAEYCYSGENNERLSEVMNYPASQEQIDQLLKNAGIDGETERVFYIEKLETVIPGLDEVLPDKLDCGEINSIAKLIFDMDEAGSERFAGFIAVKQHCGSFEEIVELAKNPGSFEFEAQPAEPVFQVYIENVHDYHIGGFTMPFPTTLDALKPFIDGVEAKGWQDLEIVDITSNIEGLGDKLSENIKKTMSPETFDELNFLAARIQEIQNSEMGANIFGANIEAKRNCGSITEIINLTFPENINRFDAWPVYDEKQYGDLLVNQFLSDEHSEAFNRLLESDDKSDRALAAHILKLEKHVDQRAFGKTTAKEEDGVFTEHGYLVGGDGVKEIYKGVQDIPDEYRLFTKPGEIVKSIMKLDDVDLAATIVQIHAVCNGNMDNAANNLKTLNDPQCRDYILTVNRSDVYLTPATDAYKRGAESNKFLTGQAMLSADRSDINFYAVRVMNDREQGVRGDVVELNGSALRESINRHTVTPNGIIAILNDGMPKTYDLMTWSELPLQQRNDFKNYNPIYSVSELQEADKRYNSFMGANETVSEAIELKDFLVVVNAVYMNAAENPQPDMIRISNEAAKEILARGDADVYKLTADGAVKLAPFEALRSACFAELRDVAVKREDISGLDKWAERKAGDIMKKAERGEQKKAKDTEL